MPFRVAGAKVDFGAAGNAKGAGLEAHPLNATNVRMQGITRTQIFMARLQ